MKHVTSNIGAWLLAALLAGQAFAQQKTIGPETSLPLPRFVSVKANQGNVRRGPSMSHRIDWVFQRRNMPVQVVAEYGHWRRVVDRDGAGGWMHYSLLSGTRTVIIETDFTSLYRQPDPNTNIVAYAEIGVIAYLEECANGWCEVRADGKRGWVKAHNLWGLTEQEKAK